MIIDSNINQYISGDFAHMEAIAFDLAPRQAIQLTSCGTPLSTKKYGQLLWLGGGPNQGQWPPY